MMSRILNSRIVFYLLLFQIFVEFVDFCFNNFAL